MGYQLFVFDLETTGTDPLDDRIVELAYCTPSVPFFGDPPVYSQRFDPGRPIPEEATEVHGISDEDVEGCPPFSRMARRIQQMVDSADYFVHYNGRTFDTLMLHYELRRCDFDGVNLREQGEVDLYQLWRRLEPRTLEGAVRRWGSNSDLESFTAHDAESDVLALFPVIEGIGDHMSQRGMPADLSDMADLCRPDDEVDRSGKLKLEEQDGETRIVFAFGKHAGDRVAHHCEDGGYVEWMLSPDRDFPADTLAIVRAIYEGVRDGA